MQTPADRRCGGVHREGDNLGRGKITEEATVAFFDSEKFLGTTPVDRATREAHFEYCFPTRDEHQVRAVFGGQKVVNDEGMVTAFLKPSTSKALTVEVKAHEIEVENTPAPVTATMVTTAITVVTAVRIRGGSDGSDIDSADNSILRKLLIAVSA